MLGGICTGLGISNDPTFLWISLNSCPVNLLLVQSHQAEIIVIKRFIQGRNNTTGMGVEPRSCNQRRRKNDTFTHSATAYVFVCCDGVGGSVIAKRGCLRVKDGKVEE